MSNRTRNNVAIPLSSSEEEDDDEEEEDYDDDEDDDEEEDEEEDDDDYDDREDCDAMSVSSSEEGMELSEEEADSVSLDDDDDDDDDDSDAAPAVEADCDRVIKLLQGECELHELKLEECKAYLRKHGLRISGTKEICIQRIKEHWRIKGGNGEKLYPRSSFTINCTGDVCQGDVVLFTQRVYKKFDVVRRGGKPIGKRTIAGRVVKESYGAARQQHTFTVEILWSKGLKKLPPLFPLLIKGRNLYRLKTFRQNWEDEAKRLKILAEKHKRGAVARHIRATKKAQSSNGGFKLHKHSGKMESPSKKPRNGRPQSSTKAQKQVFSNGRASSSGQLKETAKTKGQSGFKRKGEPLLESMPEKRHRNREPLTTRTNLLQNSTKAMVPSARHFLHAHPTGNGFPMQQLNVGLPQNNYQEQIPFQCRDGSASYVAGRAMYPSKYEVGSTSTAAGVSRNTMPVPPLRHQTLDGNSCFFHSGHDSRISSHSLSQLRNYRNLDVAPLAVQRRVHKTSQLPCSMPGCNDMGAKSCVGSFCWKCCKSTGWKCPRHKLP